MRRKKVKLEGTLVQMLFAGKISHRNERGELELIKFVAGDTGSLLAVDCSGMRAPSYKIKLCGGVICVRRSMFKILGDDDDNGRKINLPDVVTVNPDDLIGMGAEY